MTPLLNKRALLKLGYSPALITSILGKPDKVEPHAHGFKRWVEHLYTFERATAGQGDPRFLALAAKRQRREQLAHARTAAIPRQHPEWRSALPEACAGMFSLNRYAKHRICSALQKHEIYGLKNELIALLWQHGYCTLSWLHVAPAQTCRDCNGDGYDCDHCGGSGVWREAAKFWCFRFLVAGKTYCWHQPQALVEFAPREDVPPQDWRGLMGEEKPICLPRRKFAITKELIRWVIDRAAMGEEETAAIPEDSLPFEQFSFTPIPASVEQQSLFPV